ncbi:MAG TPA: endonuclease III [Candidatus Acetothermia bacterium]|nr:endonuclease III [Candidatus Acetothermia bacterium]
MPGEETLQWMARQLVESYGAPQVSAWDPVPTLILTILSQNTNDANRDRAYASLLRIFGSLERVRDALLDDIAQAIQCAGLHRQKARSILTALQTVERHAGSLDLSFLQGMSVPEAEDWLRALSGVGPKTAAIVLLFCFHRPVFPVDTHILRVMTRLGVLTGEKDPHAALNALLPPDVELMQRLHLLTIQHGREVCRARNPRCGQCVLQPVCAWARAEHSDARRQP